MKIAPDLQISNLRVRYLNGNLTPSMLVEQLDKHIGSEDHYNIWIRRLNKQEMLSYAKKLEGLAPSSLTLYGIPFAIKDNIDLAGIPITAGCPEYAYTPYKSATVVQQLIDAGAIPVGKTNLDQFATGLVGARSPYGTGRNSFNPDDISGGSSAGSAASVALGMASFSLETDTDRGQLRKIRYLGSRTALYRYGDTNRWVNRSGFFVRGLCHRRCAGHQFAWRLANLS